MASKSYPMTPAKFATLRVQLQALGVTLPDGNTGQFNPPSHPEITLGYDFNGVDTLTLTLIDDAWYETANEVWDGLAPYLT